MKEKIKKAAKSVSATKAKQRPTLGRCLCIEQVESRRMLTCLAPSPPAGLYSVDQIEFSDNGVDYNDYNLQFDGFHFATLRQQKEGDQCRGETTFRPHPDMLDVDGWGGTWYVGAYFSDLPNQAAVTAVEVSATGIHLEVEGNVPLQLPGEVVADQGDWSWQIDVTYDPEAQRVVGSSGRLDVNLASTIAEAAEYLKLLKLADQLLWPYELQTGGIGRTGDMLDAYVSYAPTGDPHDFTWDPITNPAHIAHFPQDPSAYLSIAVQGALNVTSTWDHGHPAQINIARKPDIHLAIESLHPEDTMIFGGVWTASAAQDFTADNVGLHAAVRPQDSEATALSYAISFESVPPDQPYMKGFEAELSSPSSGMMTPERDGWILSEPGSIIGSISSLPPGVYTVDLVAKGSADPTVALRVDAALIGNPMITADTSYALYSFSGVELEGGTTTFRLDFDPHMLGQTLVVDRVLVWREGDVASVPLGGAFVINGDDEVTQSRVVTLTLSSSADVTHFMYSINSTERAQYSELIPIATNYEIELPNWMGTNWINVKFVDASANESWSFDSIEYRATNPVGARSALDVSGDGYISPIDVLLVITHLNEDGMQPPSGTRDPRDTSGDGWISPVDVLLVIDYLNNPEAEALAEGELHAAAWLPNDDVNSWSLDSPNDRLLLHRTAGVRNGPDLLAADSVRHWATQRLIGRPRQNVDHLHDRKYFAPGTRGSRSSTLLLENLEPLIANLAPDIANAYANVRRP